MHINALNVIQRHIAAGSPTSFADDRETKRETVCPPGTDASQASATLQRHPTASAGASNTVSVAVLGAAGGIGQPLSLLVKSSPTLAACVSTLKLYDVAPTAGVAADLSHIDTPMKVAHFTGDAELPQCLMGTDIVIIPAGIPRKPGMTRDDLFKINASIVYNLVENIAKYCPNAWVLIISNPVNSTVPIASEVMRKHNVPGYAKRLFGVTTLDVVRANTFVAEHIGGQGGRGNMDVTVVGGHAGITIQPLLSTVPLFYWNKRPDTNQRAALVRKIQDAGTEVVKAKNGAGSATLSMAYAAVRFLTRCVEARLGRDSIVECAYVCWNGGRGFEFEGERVDYFAGPVKLGTEGVVESIEAWRRGLSDDEKKGLLDAVRQLKVEVAKGGDFVQSR
jgi:malate dehydrogenase